MTDKEARATLRRIRERLAAKYEMTFAEMRMLVLTHEAAERQGDVTRQPMPPTVHELRGGLDCEGC